VGNRHLGTPINHRLPLGPRALSKSSLDRELTDLRVSLSNLLTLVGGHGLAANNALPQPRFPGCNSCCANVVMGGRSPSRRLPRIAFRVAGALKAAEWLRLGFLIGPSSGHYSSDALNNPVQIVRPPLMLSTAREICCVILEQYNDDSRYSRFAATRTTNLKTVALPTF